MMRMISFEEWLSQKTMGDNLRHVWSESMRRILETAWNELDALADEREIHDRRILNIMDALWDSANG